MDKDYANALGITKKSMLEEMDIRLVDSSFSNPVPLKIVAHNAILDIYYVEKKETVDNPTTKEATEFVSSSSSEMEQISSILEKNRNIIEKMLVRIENIENYLQEETKKFSEKDDKAWNLG